MVCVECRFVGVSVGVFFVGTPFSFEMFAVVFSGSQVFCVPTGLFGGSSLLGGHEWCCDVGTVRDPSVEVSYDVVHVAGVCWLVAGEGVDPFSFCDFIPALVWALGTVGGGVSGEEMLKWML